MYRQLTMEERESLSQMRARKCSLAEIARRLGRQPSVFRRELSRNGGPRGGCSAVTAQRRCEARRRQLRRHRKMDDRQLRRTVCCQLRACWSPDQISGRLKVLHPRDASQHVSHRRFTPGSIESSSGASGGIATYAYEAGPQNAEECTIRRPRRRRSLGGQR